MGYRYEETNLYDLDGGEKEAYIDFVQLTEEAYFYKERLNSRKIIAEDIATRPSETTFHRHILGWDDQIVIAKSYLRYSILEEGTNLDLCEIFIEVHPDYQQQGIATELFMKLLKMAEDHKKKTFWIWITNYTLDGLVVKLMQQLGLKLALEERLNRLQRKNVDYNLLNDHLPALEVKFKTYKLLRITPKDYWQRIIDDEGFRVETADFETEAMGLIPKEDSAMEINIYSPDDMLKKAYTNVESPLGGLTLILQDSTRIIGFCETTYPKGDLSAIKWGLTGVRKQHQRKGIAMYLKLLMIKHYLGFDGFQYFDTMNNRSNVGILKINEKLGFQYVLSWMSYEGNVTEIRNKLLKKNV